MQNIHTRTWIAIAIALVVVGYVFWQGIWAPIVNRFTNTTNAPTSASTTNMNTSDNNSQNANASSTDLGQQLGSNQIGVIDVKEGTGMAAKAGDQVSIQYDGYLTDGTKFDSSYDRGQPLVFTLGSGQVIPGFDRGIDGMKVGGVRRIVIPPALAYGDQKVGSIPPNSTLLFEVTLVKIGK